MQALTKLRENVRRAEVLNQEIQTIEKIPMNPSYVTLKDSTGKSLANDDLIRELIRRGIISALNDRKEELVSILLLHNAEANPNFSTHSSSGRTLEEIEKEEKAKASLLLSEKQVL